MSSSPDKIPPAPPAETFRKSVLSSLDKAATNRREALDGAAAASAAASHCMSPEIRLQSEASKLSLNVNSNVRSPNVDASHDAAQPPPFVRRSSSLEGSTTTTTSNQPALVFKTLLRRRSTLFDSLPGRSRAGSLMTVPETRASAPSFLQRLSQNSTLLGDDLTNFPHEDGDTASLSQFTTAAAKPPAQQPHGSLFGAVMEKLKEPPGTPQPKKAAGFMSPSGKSIMNIVNQFVMSPFRFSSSPSKTKRRLLSSPSTMSRDSAGQSTPQRKRPRTDSTTSCNTLSTPSPRKPSMVNEDSMSSLHDDENWREAPLCGGQAEILDWALSKKWQLECHPPGALLGIVHTREWRDALGYWEYTSSSTVSMVSSKDLERSGSKVGRSIGTKSLTDNHGSTVKGVLEGVSKQDSCGVQPKKDPAVELATLIVRSVRPLSYSSSSLNSNNASRPTLVADGKQINGNTDVSSSQPQIREWKQSFRSLFFQWSQRVEAEENIRTAMLEYYFYCVSHDHVVLFRVDATEDHCLPRVLVSSCGESFLQMLRDTGVDTITVLEDPTDNLDAAHDKEKDAQQKNHMSPTVKADLEALRKGQAYGEVAGADVSIKIKAKTKELKVATQPKALAITVSGYDDVGSFFEVYFNRLGRVKDSSGDNTITLQSLPKLVSPHEMGPFWHSSLKALETRPVKPSKGVQGTNGIVEIHGSVVLPSMIRRIVALSASKLSVLHSKSSGLADVAPLTIRSPHREDPTAAKAGSHYVVLHTVEEEETTVKTTKSTSRGDQSAKKKMERASIIFNDIEKGFLDEKAVALNDKKIPGCRSGTTLQLVVWDVSRSNVAACKVGALSRS